MDSPLCGPPFLIHYSTDIAFVSGPGTICGCDWTGYVVKAGKDVSTPVVGDRVAGFVQGGTYEDRGAFAEYVKTSGDLTWKVPEDTLTDEQAATLGCGCVQLCNSFTYLIDEAFHLCDRFWTAVQALFHPTRLGLVEPPNKVEGEEWVLVYGGSGE